jgi:hypothetical protein
MYEEKVIYQIKKDKRMMEILETAKLERSFYERK